jgi:hypothetical protein
MKRRVPTAPRPAKTRVRKRKYNRSVYFTSKQHLLVRWCCPDGLLELPSESGWSETDLPDRSMLKELSLDEAIEKLMERSQTWRLKFEDKREAIAFLRKTTR